MDDLVEREVYYIEERERMGRVLITLYEDSRPLGSLLLEPDLHNFIIESIRELPAKWESARRQEAERSRTRQNERKGKGYDSSFG